MSRFGDFYENTVTGEYAVILRGSDDRGEGPAIVHLIARPKAAVIGEHVHPCLRERFTVVRGALETRIAGKARRLGPGETAAIEPGVAHDWWNASDAEDAHVIIEIDKASGAEDDAVNRFERLIGALFGLANDGETDRKGRPSPLQGAVIAREFQDVIVFTQPLRMIQLAAIGVLAPIGRLLGYAPTYAKYDQPHGRVDPDLEIVAAAKLSLRESAAKG